MLYRGGYTQWESRIKRFIDEKPNGKLILNSIFNGLYVYREITILGDKLAIPLTASITDTTRIRSFNRRTCNRDMEGCREIDARHCSGSTRSRIDVLMGQNQDEANDVKAKNGRYKNDPLALVAPPLLRIP
ncbi:hypothetical protein Tco_0613915 [Tanacetum coccineum]